MTQVTEIAAIEVFERNHTELLRLCGELERIADGLPDNIDKEGCLRLGQTIAATTVKAHRHEEDALFPALLGNWPQLWDLGATFDRLRVEHHADECHAEEIEEALIALGESRRGMSADALGYLLRGFFESQRRHIAFERELIAPLLIAVHLIH